MTESEAFLRNYYQREITARVERDGNGDGNYYAGKVVQVHVKNDKVADDVSYLILNTGQMILFDHDYTTLNFSD